MSTPLRSLYKLGAALCVATLSKLARPSDQQPLILEPFAPPGQRLSSLSSALTRCKMNQNKRQHQRVLERLVAHVGGVLRRTGKTEALTCAKKRKRRFDHSIVIRNLWPFFLEAEMLSMPESLQHLGCGPQNSLVVYTHLGYCEERQVIGHRQCCIGSGRSFGDIVET